MSDTEKLFDAITKNDGVQVRELLSKDQTLTKAKKRGEFKYPADMELDSMKFLGAYIGSLTGLQLAILHGLDSITADIVDYTFKEDLDERYGGGNTALHLATFLGARETVRLLLERGADRTSKNTKGFTPLDIVDHPDMRQLFTVG